LFQKETESRASYQREKAERTRADGERARAEENFRQARQAVDTFTRLSDEELPSRPAHQRVRRRFLETALEYYQGFLDQHRDDPSLEAELAANSARVSRLLDELTMLEANGPTLLFMDPVMQHALARNPEEQAAMTRLSELFERDRKQFFSDYLHLPHDERESRMAALMRQYELRIAEILAPEQLKRLRQVSLQQLFVRAFDEPRVVEALRLTPEQRAAIRAKQDEAMLALLNNWPNDPKESRGLIEQSYRNAIDQIVELLTPEQAEVWHDLVGKPFEGELRFRPPGGWLPR
jgi:hypothetical protein